MPRDQSDETERLIQCATPKDRQALLASLFTEQRSRLRRVVAIRMDPRLNGRLDPSDILQEAFIEASQRLDEFMASPPMPLFLWLRFLAVQKVTQFHRRHLRAKARDARRELSMDRAPYPQASSAAMATHFVDQSLPPSQQVARDEHIARVRDALDSMEPIDREVLVLRHFEQLSNVESARVLAIDTRTASKRHSRALRRLRTVLKDLSPSRDSEGIK